MEVGELGSNLREVRMNQTDAASLKRSHFRSFQVRDVFRLAKENSPSIIFIDEIDAIATKRFDAQTGADREVQRILLELLNQMDGFDQTTNVKVTFVRFRCLPSLPRAKETCWLRHLMRF